MLPLRWRKVIRDLASNKTRTLLVVLSIAVGVAAIGMVMGSQIIIDQDLPRDFAAVNPASASVIATSTFDDEIVDLVKAMPEVTDAQGRRILIVPFQTRSGDWRNLQLFAIPDFDDMRINKLDPEEGAWPPPEGTILIERSALAPNLGFEGIDIGDSITIKAPNGRERDLKIVGTAHDLNQFPPQIAQTAFGYVSFETLETLNEAAEYNQLDFVVTEGELYEAYRPEFYETYAAENGVSIEEARAATTEQDVKAGFIGEVSDKVQARMEDSGVPVIFVLSFPPGDHPAQTFLDSMSLLLVAMGGLALLLSGFLIINTLSAILAQQVRQIGIMKAIGARTPQLTSMYFVMVVIFGLLALMVAIPLGALGASGLAGIFGTFLNFDVRNFAINEQVVIIQVLIGLLVPLIAAIYPILKGTRTTVREAISDHGLGSGQFGTSVVDMFVVGLKRLVPMQRPVQISLRNTFRRKGRLALTLTTLSLASIIFISILSIRASLQQTLNEALDYYNFDVQMRFSRPYRVERMVREAQTEPAVAAAESWGFGSVRRVRPNDTESDNIIMYAPPADSTMINPIVLEGRWIRPDDTNALVISSDVLRNEDDLGLGDRVTLNIEGKEYEWVIVGIVRGAAPQPVMYANMDYFNRLTGDVGRALVLFIQLNREMLAEPPTLLEQLSGAPPTEKRTLSAVSSDLETMFRDRGYRIEETQTVDLLRSVLTLFFNIPIIFMLAMAALLGLVGGLGLMGTMSINVIERLREIGVMRAIGASDRSVLRVVLLEGIVIGLLSWLVGSLLAVPLSRVLTSVVGRLLLQAEPTYIFSAGGTGLWLGIVIALAVVASFLPARNASRVTVREVLSYE